MTHHLHGYAEQWFPPERPSLSDWAEQHLILASRFSNRSGPIKLFGWQREIFDSFTDPAVESSVVMSGTQLTKTIFIQAALAYLIVVDPGPAMVVQPTESDARAFSRERITPLIRECPILAGKIRDAGRDASNTTLEKEFPGGAVSIVGANSPRNLARRTIRYLFFDEPDLYEAHAGFAGDPIYLAKQRTVTFGSRRKIIIACSPTIAGRSRIAKAYTESDRRKPWVPCPHCGTLQVLKWHHVEWDKKPATIDEQAATAYYKCIGCAGHWNDIQRWASCEQAVWRAERPFAGTAGFWLSHLYSPWERLADLVLRWLKAQGNPEDLKAFVTTDLAELWEEEGETPDAEILYGRREKYPFGDNAVVPMRGLFLTAAVDVQESPPRLEVEVKAWGRNRECWSIDYRTIQCVAENGQPLPVTSPELWKKLNDEVLQRTFTHAGGRTMPIMAMAIDTGRRGTVVYEFAKKHPQPAYGPTGTRIYAPRTVIACKGRPDATRVIAAVSKEDAARKRQHVRIYSVGTVCVKQEIYDSLRNERPRADGAAVARCYHHPEYELSYFEGLCSEKRVVKANGSITFEPIPNVRNEPLDVSVYNRLAYAIFGGDRFGDKQWRALEVSLGIDNAKTPAASIENPIPSPETPAPPPPAPRPAPVIQRRPAFKRRVFGRFL